MFSKVRELEINNLSYMATLFFSFKEFKKSGHSTATDLFFTFLKRKKKKTDWIDYFFPVP
jgi:hypothetical protein